MALLELHTHFQMQKYPIPATDEFWTYFHILLLQGNLEDYFSNSETRTQTASPPTALYHYIALAIFPFPTVFCSTAVLVSSGYTQ